MRTTTTTTPTTTPSVRIVEVGPRDGLQNVKLSVPTLTKLELIRRLRETGLETIELTSFVSPKAVPQLADCRQILADPYVQSLVQQSNRDNKNLRTPVLVPNLKGLQLAMQSGVREVAVFVSATEGFSKANINASVDEGLARARQVAQKAIADGLVVRGYVSCIFADPFDGMTKQAEVLKVVKQLLDMGCYEVSLGDTLGVGTAADVRSLLGYLQRSGLPLNRLAGHFHDTFGQAISNVWEAYQCGLRVFDSSVGGLGGCPFAPGAKGNVATEDVVYLFNQAGISTGVDLAKLVDVGMWISLQLRKQNDSRTGAALAAKRQLKAGPGNATAKSPSSNESTLVWNLLNETDSLKIFRSGVNIKILLNRPRNGNTLTSAMISDITRFFQQARTDDTIRRIVITGVGKFFCTGMDLSKGDSPVAQSKAASDSQYDRLTRLFEVIDDAPQVTIAGINGPAFGGGVGLAFACDIRIAASSAAVTLSEVKLGLSPATISKFVIREWGPAFAREAMLSARPISMAELHSHGVVARVVPSEQLSAALDKYLTQLKIAAPQASTMCKDLVRLDWVDAGGDRQRTGIKDIFDQMMRPDSEGAVGLKAFQSGQKKVVWDDRPTPAPRSKL